MELQRQMLAYLDKQPNQTIFLNWQKAKHPELGDVEVGGWNGKVGSNNAIPGEILETLCHRQWLFDNYCSGLLPEMKISNVVVKKQGKQGSTNILEISADIENNGPLPTGLQDTEWMAFNRGDVVWLTGNQDKITFISGKPCEKIGNLYGTEAIAGTPKGDNVKSLKWTVAVEGNEKLKIVASSLKGGTVMEEVKYDY